MGFIGWIIFGMFVGLTARWLVPGASGGGIVMDVVVGIVGSVIGGWLYSLFGHTGVSGFNIPSFACALVGAVILLWITRSISGTGGIAR
jgi:uncharacterized membrane protein YeaQ/YmgE (transglycosylase-associated protein family)